MKMDNKTKKTFYVREESSLEDIAECVVDELEEFEPPFRITIERIDPAELPEDE
jgi:hypothetical protein